MKYYYTSSEARQRLGINVGAFYYLIETGRIKKLTPPGKKQGLYSKHQIERLAEERQQLATGEKAPGLLFLKATQDDLPEESELAALILNGSAGYGATLFGAWVRKNPETNFIVRAQGRLVAFLQVLPVKHETINRWMSGGIREWEIGAEDVLPYAPGSAVECIILSIATTPDVEKQERYRYGLRLMRGFLHFLAGLVQQGTTITAFYALGATAEGTALLRRAGFEERAYAGKRLAFVLDPLTSNARMAKAYRSVLKRRGIV